MAKVELGERIIKEAGRPGLPSSNLLERVRRVMDAFDQRHRAFTLSELSRRTELPKSTARRLAEAMVTQGFLARLDGAYVLGIRVFEWGTLVPHQDLRNVAVPFMEDLHLAVAPHVVNLAVLDEDGLLYLEKITGHRQLPAPSRVGGRLPSHRTALGKVLLAYSGKDVAEKYVREQLAGGSGLGRPRGRAFLEELREIRDNALAYDWQEASPSLACVAAPILVQDRIIAAISVSGVVQRFDVNGITPALRVAAAGIGRAYTRVVVAETPATAGGRIPNLASHGVGEGSCA
jgi:DNA-binding IclR family transcriptional regulator